MSGIAGWRSTIPWWYVGGAVVTFAVSVLLSDIVTLPAATAVVWGPFIGLEIYDRRRSGAETDDSSGEPTTAPPRRERMAAALMTAVALGTGLLVGFRLNEPPNWTAAIVGLVLLAIPLIVIGLALVRRRGAPPA